MGIDWWETFFHGVALDFWRAAISDQQTLAEANFIQEQLKVGASSEVLDVPCGNGRLALELAKRGLKLTAVDFAAEFIDEAKRNSAERSLEIEWHQRDMRDLPWTSRFDGAFCFGNSFGYMDDAANEEFLNSLFKTLKPGARFILDAPAIAECLLPNLKPNRSIEIGNIKTEIATSYDPDQRRMFNEFTFIRDGQIETRSSSQRIYAKAELDELLKRAGFKHVADYSSFAGEDFGEGASRLLSITAKLT